MPRYAARDALTEKVIDRLVSLGSASRIAQVRASGHDDVVPANLAPSARAYLDPRTGRLYSRKSVQTAKTFFDHRPLYRSMDEATPERAARERLLEDVGFHFPGADWQARRERDERVTRMERAYKDRLRREGKPVPRGRKALYERESEFRELIGRLSQPTPPGTKRWTDPTAQRRKTKALEQLGLRPKGFRAATGSYDAAELAAAWRAAGVAKPPKMLKGKWGKRRRRG